MLTVTCGDVVLRPAAEADDDTLVTAMPDDFDHDPTFAPLPGESVGAMRARWLRSWLAELREPASGEDRTIPFVVEVGGRVVGLQTLEGEGFTRRREVASTSFLAADVRGRGYGVAMRTAMLTVAFDVMGAARATSDATPDNVASRRISERLGYRFTGRTSDVVAGVERPLDHFALTRAEWNEVTRAAVAIEVDRCRVGGAAKTNVRVRGR